MLNTETMVNRTVFHHASIFLYNPVSTEDIGQERERLEAKYRMKLAVWSVEPVIRHGVQCTRLTWEVV